MVNRHPLLSVVAVLYVAAVLVLSLARDESGDSSFISAVLLLVPLGVMLVLLLGNARWYASIALGTMVCVWLELGRNAWFANRNIVESDFTANVLGLGVGVALTSIIVGMVTRRRRQDDESLSPLSQERR